MKKIITTSLLAIFIFSFYGLVSVFAQTTDVTSGLVGNWKFDEGTGTSASDSSGNNNTGALFNSPTWVTGKFGKALSFDGVNDYVEVGDKSTLDGFTNLSISLWFQTNTDQIGVLVNKYENLNNNGYYLAVGDRFFSSDKVTFMIDGASEDMFFANTSVTDGQWHHLVAVYQGGIGPKIYIDGLEQFGARTGKLQNSIGTAPGRSFRIGQYSPGGYNFYYKGLMDEVRVYNRALSVSEVEALYGGSATPSATPTPQPTPTVPSPLPACSENDWSCGSWNVCSQNSNRTRTCNKISNCQGGASSPATSQTCTYEAPIPSCTSFNYSSWSECSQDGKQTRNVIYKYPSNCEGGESPKTTQSCTYIPPAPACDADTWTCSDWNTCSVSGTQSRSCKKTFDCPNVETAPPPTNQYCEAPNKPKPQTPPSDNFDDVSIQDSIIKSTVRLLCLFDAERAMQGSGTVIDPSGVVLTNKHVVSGTLGCFVGFVDDFNDEPYFGDRQIADIVKVSTNENDDIAVLKIRNPQNRQLNYIDITKGSNRPRLGTKISIYGYPAVGKSTITYTSGDFSGTDGNYFKTSAVVEQGNSGGGAYLKDGTFIGIPSAVIRGKLNALGYILSISRVNAWLGNPNSFAYGGGSNNNYSRVSVLEDINLKKLDSLQLIVPGTKDYKEVKNKATQNPPATPPNIIKKTTPSQIQKEVPGVIKKVEQKEKVAPQVNPTPVKKLKWYQKIFN